MALGACLSAVAGGFIKSAPQRRRHAARTSGAYLLAAALALAVLAPAPAEAQTNNAPTVPNPIPDRVAAVGTQLAFAEYLFADADGDTLSYTATKSDGTALPGWLTFGWGVFLVFSGTPAAADVGTVSVKVTASDGLASVSDAFDIVVRFNSAPTVANPIPDQTARAGSAFSYTFPPSTFADADGDTLTYWMRAFTTHPTATAWLTFNENTRTFSGTPRSGHTVLVVLFAEDGFVSTLDDFEIVVASESTASGPGGPPAAPERLQVTPLPSGLRVTWGPPAGGDDTPPVSGYNLAWRPAGAEDWTGLYLAAGDDYPMDDNVVRHTIDGLDNGTLYEVRVQAVGHAGKGPWSATASGTPVVVSWLAPYWQGTGGFVVRPEDGRSAWVRVNCGGRRITTREYAGDDGLIARSIQRCLSEDGEPLPGDLIIEGIEDGGWYWINGDRNVAIAPLVVEAALNDELRPPVPGGVTASPTGDLRFVREVVRRLYGTLMVHEGNGMMAIVPHLTDMEGDGAHVAPYWKGRGGIVGRPLDGESAEVRLSCGDGEAETFTLEPGEDGIIVTLLPRRCFDSEGAAIAGHLEADGFEDGAWYWINASVPFAAPLVARDRGEDTLTVPLIPEGVEAEEGPLGTLFSRGSRTGVVPRVRTAPP